MSKLKPFDVVLQLIIMSLILYHRVVSAAETKTITQPVIVFLGDSLTAGYGVEKDEAYPALIAKKFKAKGTEVKIINAGVSGSTSASGPARIKWQIKSSPTYIVLALGANDALRGIKPEETLANLRSTVRIAKENKIKIILLGMKAPPNYGKKFSDEFEASFKKIAKEEQIDLMPFFLEGVAGEKSLNQPDGIHPNARGQEVIADNVFQFLQGKIK